MGYVQGTAGSEWIEVCGEGIRGGPARGHLGQATQGHEREQKKEGVLDLETLGDQRGCVAEASHRSGRPAAAAMQVEEAEGTAPLEAPARVW